MTVHAALAWLAAGLTLVVLGIAALGWARRPVRRLALDRAILAVEAVVLVAVMTGALHLATAAGPRDPLHFVYAAAALLLLPIGRFWRGLDRGARPTPIAISAVVLLGVLVRLSQTG